MYNLGHVGPSDVTAEYLHGPTPCSAATCRATPCRLLLSACNCCTGHLQGSGRPLPAARHPTAGPGVHAQLRHQHSPPSGAVRIVCPRPGSSVLPAGVARHIRQVGAGTSGSACRNLQRRSMQRTIGDTHSSASGALPWRCSRHQQTLPAAGCCDAPSRALQPPRFASAPVTCGQQLV